MSLSLPMRGWLALAYKANVSGRGGSVAMQQFKALAQDPKHLKEAQTELARIRGMRILNLAQRDFATYQIMKALEAGIAGVEEEARKNAP